MPDTPKIDHAAALGTAHEVLELIEAMGIITVHQRSIANVLAAYLQAREDLRHTSHCSGLLQPTSKLGNQPMKYYEPYVCPRCAEIRARYPEPEDAK